VYKMLNGQCKVAALNDSAACSGLHNSTVVSNLINNNSNNKVNLYTAPESGKSLGAAA